jgi:hypothetical protein
MNGRLSRFFLSAGAVWVAQGPDLVTPANGDLHFPRIGGLCEFRVPAAHHFSFHKNLTPRRVVGLTGLSRHWLIVPGR